MTRRIPLSAAVSLSAAALLFATQASAHAALVRSNPAANATISAPRAISLTFNEKLSPAFSGFSLTMSGGMTMKVKTTLSKDHKTITGVPTGRMMAGVYKISWHAAAADDGHRTQGVMTFKVK